MSKANQTLIINVKISWRTLIKAAFMRVFCRELYNKFEQKFNPGKDVQIKKNKPGR